MNKGYIVYGDHVYCINVLKTLENACCIEYQDGYDVWINKEKVFEKESEAYLELKKYYQKEFKETIKRSEKLKKMINMCDERSKNESVEIK